MPREELDLPPRITASTLYDMYYIATGGLMTPVPSFAASVTGARIAKQADGSVSWANDLGGFGAQFGDGVNALAATSYEVSFRAPSNGTIYKFILDADISASCTVNLKKNGTTIFGGTSVKPTLSSASTQTKTDMTDIVVTYLASDLMTFSLDTVSGSPKRITLTVFSYRNS